MNILSLQEKKIISFLLNGDKSLTSISKHLEMSKPAALKYLNGMEGMGMVCSEARTTRYGRERLFRVGTFSSVLSIDPVKGAMLFSTNSSLDTMNPLMGQIGQEAFREVVSIYVEEIAAILSSFSAVLFGSIARGEAGAKSDMDILLLKEGGWTKEEKDMVSDALYAGSLKAQVQAKPQFFAFEAFLQKDDAFAKRIKEDGLIVYDAIGDERLWPVMKRYWNIID
ncbi:MAG: ArsR family transcriptional regulator [Thermoplasmata archaeon]|nr:ArsR family transcriptional regulator [Thermoplasmata archaeon]